MSDVSKLTDAILRSIRPVIEREVEKYLKTHGVDTSPKIPVVENAEKEVVIVTEYSKASNALFGDFGQGAPQGYQQFKDEFLKRCRWIKANSRLKFGFGWVYSKTREEELEKAFQEAGIPVRVVKMIDYEKEIKVTSETEEEV